MKYYLNNPLSNNGIEKVFTEDQKVISVIGLDFKKFFDELKEEDEVVLCGGDGTLNRFINDMDGYEIKNNVYLLGGGTGNDFLNDIEKPAGEEILINQYLKNLPTVTVKGKKYKFINNMAYGIDGWVCEEADRLKAKNPNKKLNYTSIAIKGLLFKYKPKHVTVTVDDKEPVEFDHVWLAPTMKGRFYGGGMMIAPAQNRLAENNEVSVVIYHCRSKIKTLMVFPSIFKGEHVLKTDMCTVLTGHKVHVKYNIPSPSQIDGETIVGVEEYWVEA